MPGHFHRRGSHKHIGDRPAPKISLLTWLASLVVSTCILGTVSADVLDNRPEDIVEYRQLIMRSLELHMLGIESLVEGKIDHWRHVRIHAETIERMSRDMAVIFPHWTGPTSTKTGALPAIWEDWQDFKTAAAQLEKEATALVESVGSIERRAIHGLYSRVRQICDACHSRFAKPQ